MYVHIGRDNIIDKSQVIAILDLETINNKKELKDILDELNIKNQVIDISENNKKSLIIIEENKITKAFISNISSITLAKRIQKDII